MDHAIIARGLSKTFGELTAVEDLTLQVAPGEIFGLVGPDGAGKTTSLRMLSSIMEPSSGEAVIAGFDISRAEAVKDNIAYMSQRFGLYEDLTVEENIHFYADLYGVPRKGRAERIHGLLEFSSMQQFTKRRAGDLSGGMKQKLQLVCALIHTPKVLLLDEPTNGVDPVSRRDFWRILYRLLRQDVAILVSTAYLDEAERCNRVGLLSQGKLLAVGTPADVKDMMEDRILSVKSSHARSIHRLLSRTYGMPGVTVFGDTVHVTSRDTTQDKEKIQTILNQEGVHCEEIRELGPSLEDVFVHVLGGDASTPPQHGMDAYSHDIKTSSRDGVSRDEPAVEVVNLTRRFGHFTAVDAVNFTVPRGEIFGFLGPNGAGKSTVIRMLCGVLEPSNGTGTVAGFDIRTQTERIKQHIGYMSQKFSLYEDLTVEENIDFYGGIYGLENTRLEERKMWAVEMSGLKEHRRSLTSILSTGWKQRLAMACAILHEPPILFLDEPTSGVDPVSRRRFWDLIYEMAGGGVTVFVTTHYMEEAEYCDRLALIYRGRIIALGNPEELKTRIMQDTILEIQCPRPQDVLEEIARLPAVREAALFGAGMHVVVDDAPRA
ncbi:MAG: ATP-binding cassette domain-containing protein, partial [Desulfomonilia bacterium]